MGLLFAAIFAWLTAKNLAISFPLLTTPAAVFTLPSSTPTISPESNNDSTPPPTISTKKPTPTPVDTTPWGQLQQVGEHTYKIRVQNDSTMGSPEEILGAINDLRRRYGSQPLKTDSRLCAYAQDRANYFVKIGNIDAHKGFEEFLEKEDGFHKLGFGQVGENSSYGYIMSGVHLVEFVYMASPSHNQNQLDPKWDRGCVGTAGSATNIIFATSPL